MEKMGNYKEKWVLKGRFLPEHGYELMKKVLKREGPSYSIFYS